MVSTKQLRRLLIYAILISLLGIAYFINIFSVIRAEGLFDFGSFIGSGQLASLGRNPYSLDSPLINKVSFPEIGVEGYAPNLNPPISVLLFRLFAQFDPYQSLLVWRIITIALFIISILLLNHAYPVTGFWSVFRLIWAFSLAGLWHTIRLGQIYGVLILLTVLIYIMLKKQRPILAGLFLGILIALKPNFVFWAFLLLVAGNWRSFLSSGITTLAISTVPIFTNGYEIYQQWLTTTSMYTTPNLLIPGNNSLQGLTSHFGSAFIGVIMSIILCILTSVFVRIYKPPLAFINSFGIICSLFISPIAWTGYTILTLPIFFENKEWNWFLKIAAGIFTFPFILIFYFFSTSPFNFVFWDWFYGWGLLMMLVWIFYSCIGKYRILSITRANKQGNYRR